MITIRYLDTIKTRITTKIVTTTIANITKGNKITPGKENIPQTMIHITPITLITYTSLGIKYIKGQELTTRGPAELARNVNAP